jgi:hypothetical protein
MRSVAWGIEAHLDGAAVMNRLGTSLPPPGRDLLEIAARAHVVDRMTPRGRPSNDPLVMRWRRNLSLELPLLEADRWRTEHVQEALVALLDWVSDDHWIVAITAATTSPLDAQQAWLFDTLPEKPARVALLSGGLDSAAGLCHELADASSGIRNVVTVSLASVSRLTACQNAVRRRAWEAADPRAPSDVPLTFDLHLKVPGRENSQRTRGLLFLAAGVASALACGAEEVIVWENGLGALNLPMVASQVGSMATRAVHPRTLFLLDALLEALNVSVRVNNPYLLRTKAEMIRNVPTRFDAALSASISCDSGFSHRRKAQPHLCGRCTSCLLRRQSLMAAGRADLDAHDAYRTDYTKQWIGASDIEFASMLWQISSVEEALRQPEPWPALMQRFPALARLPETYLLEPAPILRLLSRYVEEWQSILPSFGVSPRHWGLRDVG